MELVKSSKANMTKSGKKTAYKKYVKVGLLLSTPNLIV